jgi:AAA domain/UvrD-like helicase C-terminal domain
MEGVAGASRQEEIAKEQDHVDRVYSRLATLRAEAERIQREGYRIARARTPGSLVERDAMVYHAARRLRELDAEYEGIVFGRLDLHDGEVRHIGRLGLRDDEHEPLVIDWRAPGAAAFYQATAPAPMGVVRRRVIRCQGPRVIDVEDDLLDLGAADTAVITAVGDGALIASLARARGERMRDIVATIQREQDEAIRAPAGGVTMIEGGPGTGKTAVALHRAAHLLYRDRRRYEGGGVLLVGPSPNFISYVERVLPSLGEETVELRALGEVVDGIRSDRLDPPVLARLKGDLRMRRLLQRALREEPPDAPAQLRVVYGGEVLRLDAGPLAQLRRELHRRVHRANAAAAEVRRTLVEALWQLRPDGVAWSPRRFAEEVADRTEFERFLRAWWPTLTPAQVLGWLADPARVRRAARPWLTAAQADLLARSWATSPADPSIADVALMDELRVQLGEAPAPRRRRMLDDTMQELSTAAERHFGRRERAPRPDNYDGYAHVLVDEAQDISPMQWRLLGRRGQYASWTIVGDAAQSAWPDPAQAARARDEALRGKTLRRFHLDTNYRNSAEIFELAAEVVRPEVPDADLPRAVRRTGVPPQHRCVPPAQLAAAVTEAIAQMLAAVEGTVGVIAAATRRDEVAAWLDGKVPPDRLQVVDAMRAKGMEYDGVVIVEPAEIAASVGVRVLYVALTRATHRLSTVGRDASWLPALVTKP